MLLAAVPARADQIILQNGDRITGTLISLANGTLTFQSNGATFKIAWPDVVSVAVDEDVYVTVAGNAPILTTFEAADSNGRITLMPGGPVLLDDIVAIRTNNSEKVITGGGGVGFVQTTGNTEINNTRVGADLTIKSGPNRYSASGSQTHARDRGVETARNWSVTGKYDRFIWSRLFATANAVLTNDRFRDIDLRTAYGAGLGLQLIDRARVKLSGSGGVGEVRENFISIPDDSYQAAYESGALTLVLRPGLAELFHSHDGYFQISQGDKKFFRTQNGIRFGLGAGFVATLQHDLDFDRRPSPGRLQTDKTISFTLGYRF